MKIGLFYKLYNKCLYCSHISDKTRGGPGGLHLGFRIQSSEVRAPLESPYCVLEQDIFTPQEVLVIHRKRWLHPNMTEKLFTGMLSIKPNQKIRHDEA